MFKFKKTLLTASFFVFGNSLLWANDNINITILMAGLLQNVSKLGEINTPKKSIKSFISKDARINFPAASKSKQRTTSFYSKNFAARRENFKTNN